MSSELPTNIRAMCIHTIELDIHTDSNQEKSEHVSSFVSMNIKIYVLTQAYLLGN